MRRQVAILAIAFVVVAGAATSALYAQDSRRDGMMGSGGMMGMMGMMQQMSRMMDQCSQMMSGHPRDGRPNDQWRRDDPPPPSGRNG